MPASEKCLQTASAAGGLRAADPPPTGTSPLDPTDFMALFVRKRRGRMARHNALNELVARGFASARLPSTKELVCLFWTDGKRPDGLTLVLWQSGKSLYYTVSQKTLTFLFF